MKVLITGHRGFVGRHFTKALEDHRLTTVDIVENKDARDFFRHNDTSYDLVIHLAAIVGGRKMIELFPLALSADLSIDAEMAQWALRTKPTQLVYFSSSAAYPIELQQPGSTHKLKEQDINLNDIRQPDMSYGWAKLTGEMLCKYLREQGLTVLVLRPFSGYGADQSQDYPFPSLIRRGLLRANPFQIWGSEQTVRDWVHIEDIVEATLLLAKCRLNVTVNLATGRPTPFGELARMICQQVGYQPDLEVALDAPRGVAYRVGDPTFLHSLGYSPRISLEEGVARALSVGL